MDYGAQAGACPQERESLDFGLPPGRQCTGVTAELTIPKTVRELAESLQTAAARKHTITLLGNGTKELMGGPVEPSEETISTTALNRVLDYEPRDLTISVEAGLPWRELDRKSTRLNSSH